MYKVLEICCGPVAGPRFENATDYYISDIDEDTVIKAAESEPRVVPLVADASSLPFRDAGMNAVVARNVFGHRLFGLSANERSAYAYDLFHLNSQNRQRDMKELLGSLESSSAPFKDSITREAGRVLIAGGQLIVVEQRSPSVAERYFQQINPTVLEEAGLTIAEADIFEVTPPNYAERHHPAKIWVATKS